MLYGVMHNKNYLVPFLLKTIHKINIKNINKGIIITIILKVPNNVYITLLGIYFSTHYSSKPILFHIYLFLLLFTQRGIHNTVSKHTISTSVRYRKGHFLLKRLYVLLILF